MVYHWNLKHSVCVPERLKENTVHFPFDVFINLNSIQVNIS